MRKCKPFAQTSSADEVAKTKEDLDESGESPDILNYISALVRSEDESNVRSALDYIDSKIHEFTEDEYSMFEFYIVLAFYRLKMDNECVKRVEYAIKEHHALKETVQIRDKILAEQKEDKERTTEIAIGVGATVVSALAIITGIVLGTRRRH